MTDATLEKNLQAFDYSVFSKVKDSLLAEILQKQNRANMRNFKSVSQIMAEEILTDEELDCVAAAGNPTLDANKKNF